MGRLVRISELSDRNVHIERDGSTDGVLSFEMPMHTIANLGFLVFDWRRPACESRKQLSVKRKQIGAFSLLFN